ncbi:MAG: molybdopterin-dependent oxidoreductase [Thermodesulfobacteriota bacterium]
MKLDRRNFLKLVVGAAAGFHLTPIPWRIMDDVAIWTQNWPWVPALARAEEGLGLGVCTLCEGGCGLEVRVAAGQRTIGVQGAGSAPVNQGRICPLGAAATQYQYSPARYHGPVKRIGARGTGTWTRLTWPEAFKEIGGKLAEIRKNGQAHTMVLISGRRRSLLQRAAARFLTAYGSPNFVEMPSLAGNRDLAERLQFGRESAVGYDLEKSGYVLSFGAALIEGWGSPALAIRSFSQWREGRKTKLIQVDTRASLSASKADQWLAVAPGSEGALALGLAQVITREGLYNRDFIFKYTYGFDEFQAMLVKEYPPERVAALTGLPVQTIIGLAREFARAERPVALAGKGKGALASPVYEVMAVMALNALVGNINQPGGVIVRRDLPLAGWPEPVLDETARAGLNAPRLDQARGPKYPLTKSLLSNLIQAVVQGRLYPVDVLILDQANPAHFGADPGAFKTALEKVPLVISVATWADDSSLLADYVLPESTGLESPAEALTPPTLPYPLFGLASPLIAPAFDTRPGADIYIGLAKAVGGPLAKALPFKDQADMLGQSALGLYKSGRGQIAKAGGPPPGDVLGREDQIAGFKDEKAFRQALAKGVFWYDQSFRYGDLTEAFQTPSRKFEFLSQTLQTALTGFLTQKGVEPALAELGMTQKAEFLCLPHFEPYVPSKPEPGYPLLMMPVEQFKLVTSTQANAPYLTKLLEDLTLKNGYLCVELHPRTAADLHLHEGDLAWLKTRKGRIIVMVHFFEGARPGVIYTPVGLGHTGFDLYLRNKGANPLEIMEPAVDPLSGEALWWAARANLIKA